jgi:hypothetical protein
MDCRLARQQLAASPDTPSADAPATALAQHLAGCSVCRQVATHLETLLHDWRAETAAAPAPSWAAHWGAVRAQISGAPRANSSRRPAWLFPVGAALPIGAMAAWALLAWRTPIAAPAAGPQVAAADFIETADGSTPLVYVDQESGWLIVWAAGEAI